jgi:hypothetical protein
MNAWSQAHIELVAVGDKGRPNGVGSMRTVRVLFLGRTTRLEEVIQSAAYPHTFVYRVIPGGPLEAHRGELTLSEQDGGTMIRWRVDATVRPRLLSGLIRSVLERQLRQSLRELDIVSKKPIPWEPWVEDALCFEGTESQWRDATETLNNQRALADTLAANKDPRVWFSRVYQYVTEAQLEACRSRQIDHVSWVLLLIPLFDAYYRRSFDAWSTNDLADVEQHWKKAFQAMSQPTSNKKQRARVCFRGLHRAIKAHIETDLPRCLRDVYLTHHASLCDFVRFRADYILMGPLFMEATERLLADFPKAYLPWRLRFMGKMMPRASRRAYTRRNFYDVHHKRMAAFNKAHAMIEGND